jgi:hypothetical protein
MRAGRRAARSSVALLVALGAFGGGVAAAEAATISTIAGSGDSGFSGDGAAATSAKLNGPRGVSFMPDGGFLIADFWNSRVRRVSASGQIDSVAGTGAFGYNGSGIAASSAQLNNVHDVAGLADGSYLIDDEENQRVRRVGTDGIIRTAAGTGTKGFSGDGGPATSARISSSRGMAATSGGGFLIADSGNNRIRCVTPAGTITTVAGTGTAGFSGDGGRATEAQLARPFDVAPTYDGGFVIADIDNNRVRYVSPEGVISTIAGTGADPDPDADGSPAPGDGGSALAAAVKPWSVAGVPGGGVLLADSIADRVRQVSPTGTITTAAGSGVKASTGDGGEAPAAAAWGPRGLAVRPDGSFLIAEFGPNAQADAGGDRIRMVGGGLLAPFALPAFKNDCDYRPKPPVTGGTGTAAPPPAASPAPPKTVKLTLRVDRRLRARKRRTIKLRYRVSRSATIALRIARGKRGVVTKRQRARGGRNTLTLRRGLLAGRYSVSLKARSSDGQVARARAALRVVLR